MTVEIHRPAVEALISRLMATGRFPSVEDALLHAFRSTPLPETLLEPNQIDRPKRRLKLDPPLISPAGRVIDLTNDQIYELIKFP